MKSLTTKLIALVLIIVTIGMLLISISSLYIMKGAFVKESMSYVKETAKTQAAHIDGWLDRQRDYMNSISINLEDMDDFNEKDLKAVFNKYKELNPSATNVYVGKADGTIIYAKDKKNIYEGDWQVTDTPWYIGALDNKGEPYMTDAYINSKEDIMSITISKLLKNSKGKVLGVVAMDVVLTEFKDFVHDADTEEGEVAFLVSSKGRFIAAADSEYASKKISEIDHNKYEDLWQAYLNESLPVKIKEGDGATYYYNAAEVKNGNWVLFSKTDESLIKAPIHQHILNAIAMWLIVILITLFVIYWVMKSIVIKPLVTVRSAAESMSKGDVGDLLVKSTNDEIGLLTESFNHMIKRIQNQVSATREMARGNLSVKIPVSSYDDEMGKALYHLHDVLVDFVETLTETGVKLDEGASEITLSANHIAMGAMQQKEAVKELNLAMSKISDHARGAEQISREARELLKSNIGEKVDNGSRQMGELIQAVEEVRNAGNNIGGIIKMIDEIAFRTNILAINATVEAARAGEDSKGFTVIADEIRTLAKRSADAAQDTEKIIEEMIKKVNLSSDVAGETIETFESIFGGIDVTTGLAVTVNDAARYQLGGIMHIHEQIENVYDIVNMNEQSSVRFTEAANNLYKEASKLTEIVSEFNTEKTEGTNENSNEDTTS